MNAMRTAGMPLERYNKQIADALKQVRETYRHIQRTCPHVTVYEYNPSEHLLVRLRASTKRRGVQKRFSHMVFRICPTCGLEEEMGYSGTLPEPLQEDDKERIFPKNCFRIFYSIGEDTFNAIRNMYSGLASDED